MWSLRLMTHWGNRSLNLKSRTGSDPGCRMASAMVRSFLSFYKKHDRYTETRKMGDQRLCPTYMAATHWLLTKGNSDNDQVVRGATGI